MLRLLPIGIVCASLACLVTGPCAAAPASFTVSTQGVDTNPGTAEQPFASLERARDAIRQLKTTTGLPPGGVTVWVRGGVYRITKTFELTKADAGTAEAPIVYRATEGEAVSLMGGTPIPPTAFAKVTDPAVLPRLDESAREQIVVADLGKLGVTDYGKPWPTNFRGYNGWPELFFDGQAQQLARWPNEGFARMGKVVDSGSKPRVAEKPDRPGTFAYDGDRPARWLTADAVYLDGYWAFKWYNDTLKVGKIDPAQKTITFVGPHVYGIGGPSGGEYFALNLLEELDRPGEYFVDRTSGRLYFWPPAPLADKPIAISTLDAPMVTLTDTSYVTVRKLIFEVSRGMAATISGGEHNLIAACTVRSIASDAMRVSGGHDNGASACELYALGGGGISVSGGDRATLTPANNYASNNHIHHYGRLYRTHHDAINLNGCGCRAGNNLIHDAPHHAVDFMGNNHVFEYNEVFRVCLETDDAGAIYTGRNWAAQGNIIRNNYFHDIGGGPNCGNQAIYLDDCASGTTCTGNLISRVGRAFLLGGGRDNVITNNIIVDCPISVHIDNRGVGIARTKDENYGTLTNDFKTLPWQGPLWAARYPHLPTYLEDQPGYPKYNLVTGNLIVRCGRMNLAKEAQELSTIADNYTTADDPGFVDAAHDDFRFKPDAVGLKQLPGFTPVPVEKIGLRRDEYRTTLPVFDPYLVPAPRAFVGQMEVTLGCRSAEAALHYTLDGTEPTAASPRYRAPLQLTGTTTVKVAGFSGQERSATVQATYEELLLGEGHGVYLGDWPAAEVAVYGTFGRNTGIAGKPLVIGGRAYARGLLTHPNTTPQGGRATVSYALTDGLQAAHWFRALVGIDDSAKAGGSCAFIVEVRRQGQWQEVFRSAVLRGGQPPVEVKADISGADRLRLVVTDGGDNINSDHAAWYDARVE